MGVLVILRGFLSGAWSLLSAIIATEPGSLILAAVAAFVIGDLHGSRGERAEAEKTRLEATVAAQKRDLAVTENLAKLARTHATESGKAKAEAEAALAEIKAHANDRDCRLSADDASRLQRIR